MMHFAQGNAVAMWMVGAGVPLLMDLPLKALYNATCQQELVVSSGLLGVVIPFPDPNTGLHL